ncbi:unnamed protein product [Orchesella dallaii]|uniref:Uncharacterized protein n=1 Tax=Orchesella dallaii TaxID=48710 RepID=A0ABP1S4S4_9HEXA
MSSLAFLLIAIKMKSYVNGSIGAFHKPKTFFPCLFVGNVPEVLYVYSSCTANCNTFRLLQFGYASTNLTQSEGNGDFVERKKDGTKYKHKFETKSAPIAVCLHSSMHHRHQHQPLTSILKY